MDAAIETRKLSKVFGNRRAVDNVSITVPRGAFLSIFGPNGAGKTTLLRVLSTLSRATSGSAKLMGIDTNRVISLTFIISGFLATGSISASILQLILIILDVLLYLPFIANVEKRFRAEEGKED